MEEKLYFKPATYGKGIKKKDQSEKPTKAEQNETTHRTRNLILSLALVIIIILIILWLLRGKTTTSGQYPANIRNESLSCASTDKSYEPANRISSNDKELKIDMIFYGTEKLSSASLKYTLTFISNEEAYSAEAFNHAGFNLDLQNRGFSSGEFNNKFTLIDNTLVLTLHADADALSEDLAREYFLLSRNNLPTTLQDFRQHYEAAGFACSSTIDNS
ncbi:hypothetical protein IJF89_00525 [Candidatus Saccharibacteria bacterium]|nr:hypothetical protein [Candidatus Saccharibacteria bacterium]